MAGFNYNLAVVMALMVASIHFHGTAAQTTHVVGDALGWTVPPTGAAAYTTWASGQTFTVGDVLLFNFTTGNHDVVEVAQAAYGPCTATNPISMVTAGPARLTLNAAGTHYYICAVGSHCQLGQRLTINVSAASGAAPAPAPTADAPVSPPATAPTLAPVPSTTTPPPFSSPAPSTTTPPPSSSPAPSTTTPPPSSSPAPSTTTPPPASSPSPSATESPPSPSTSGQSPTGSTTPSPTSSTIPPPPPPSSAASSVTAVVPVTLLAIAMALFY